MISKRGLLLGGLSILAAPAIVRAASLMPISTNAPKTLMLAPGVYVTEVDFSDIIFKNVWTKEQLLNDSIDELNRLQSVKGSTSLW